MPQRLKWLIVALLVVLLLILILRRTARGEPLETGEIYYKHATRVLIQHAV